MAHTHSPRPPRASAPVTLPATPRAKRHDGWTLPKQVAFLRALSATHSAPVTGADAFGVFRM